MGRVYLAQRVSWDLGAVKDQLGYLDLQVSQGHRVCQELESQGARDSQGNLGPEGNLDTKVHLVYLASLGLREIKGLVYLDCQA